MEIFEAFLIIGVFVGGIIVLIASKRDDELKEKRNRRQEIENPLNALINEIEIHWRELSKEIKEDNYRRLAFLKILTINAYTSAISTDTFPRLSPETQRVVGAYYSDVNALNIQTQRQIGEDVSQLIISIWIIQEAILGRLKKQNREAFRLLKLELE